MAPTQVATVSQEEQLEDLKRRFTLLEGERKANMETAKMTIQQNREIIAQLKEENKQLRHEVGKCSEEKPQTTEQQLECVVNEVQALQRKFDTMKHSNTKSRGRLDTLDKKVSELNIGSRMFSSEADPELRQIRVMENRLDKAMIKHNEALSIKKTYEQILKRLQEERMGFDSSLAGIERTLKSKERDYEELLLLSHDAYHAKEMAQAELHRFEQGVMEERGQRDREVQEKKALVEQRVSMNKKLDEHQRKLKQQQESEAQAKADREAAALSEGAAGSAGEPHDEERQRIDDYEGAFQIIKEATGVDDVNEVIQKFLTQEDTQSNLQNLTKANQATADKLAKEMRALRAQVEELKFCGTANRHHAIDEHEARITEATEKTERNRMKYERLAKLLIDMKAGIGHLSEQLRPLRLENESSVEMSDETVEEVLQQCELKVMKLLAATQAVSEDEQRGFGHDRYEEKMMLQSQADIRVKVTEDEDPDDDDDAFDEEGADDVRDRKQVKNNSEHILEKQATKLRRKGRKSVAAAPAGA